MKRRARQKASAIPRSLSELSLNGVSRSKIWMKKRHRRSPMTGAAAESEFAMPITDASRSRRAHSMTSGGG